MKNPRFWVLRVLCALALVCPFVMKDTAGTKGLTAQKVYVEQTEKIQTVAQKQTPDVPASDLAKIQQGIAEQEYHIQYQPKAGCLQSPNRKQNLRFSYSGKGFSAQARKDSTGTENWNYRLKIKGVYKGTARLPAHASPTYNLRGNQLTYDYGSYQAQYINNEEGMRQNFIVKSKPEGDGLLKVALNIEGNLRPDLAGSAELVLGTPAAKGTIDAKVRYKDLKVWDAQNKTLPAHMELQGRELALVVDDKDAAYPVTIDPISTSATTTLEINQASAIFGYSVASAGDVNGDGYSDVIIGARYYDNGNTDEGAAFIFHGSASGITTTIQTQLECNQTSAQMGYNVASAGDVNGDGYSDVIVTAPYYDNGNTDEGAAFVFHGSSSGVTTTVQTQLEGNQTSANFGYFAAGAGDVNGDGYSDVIVGAPYYDNGNTDEGAAFVYHGSSSGISTTIQSQLEVNQNYAQFGWCVASAGDVNGDGYSDVIVGANNYDNGQTDEGAAFVFHGSSSGINTTIKAQLESNQAYTYAGHAVSSAGDVNGDGYSDVIVGFPLYDDGNTDEGAAAVYFGSSSGVSTTIQSLLEVNQNSALMGYSVAPAGDVNGDGYGDIIIGANQYDNGNTDEGAAFVYIGSSTGITGTIQSQMESNQDYTYMGHIVASAGDVNGDGYSDVIVGLPNYDNGNTDEGQVRIYLGAEDGFDTTQKTSIYGGQSFAHLGYSVSSAGDVNGDGYSDIIIGANLYDDGETDEGAAFVYLGSSSGINTTANATLESNQPSANLGQSVAGAGDINGDGYSDILVSSIRYNNGHTFEGGTFIYYGSSSGITGSPTILSSHQQTSYFGQSVAGAGDVNGDGYSDIIVGAYSYDDGNYNEGVAMIYHGSASGIDTTVKTMLEGNQGSAYFGWSVSSAGDVNGDGYSDVVVGAYAFDNGNINEGAAFVYLGSSSGIDTTIQAQLECNQTSANLGWAVAGTGDVNGDGYSDIIIGAKNYKNTISNEGSAFVYYGSSSGITSTVQSQYLGGQSYAYMGAALACAGDVNGDGYSDVIIGAFQYDNGNSNEGAAFVYLGSSSGLSNTAYMQLDGNGQSAFMGWVVAGAGDVNGDGYSDVIAGGYQYKSSINAEGGAIIALGSSGKSPRRNLRLYNVGTTTPLTHDNFTETQFAAGLYAKSFLGKQKGKMVWETVAEGVAFSTGSNGEPANSVSKTSQQASYTDLGLSGNELTNDIDKTGAHYSRVRGRVKYDPVTAITGQVYGRWIYPGTSPGMNIAPLPVEMIYFNASWQKQCATAMLRWATASETNSAVYEVERSFDGRHWARAGSVQAAGYSNQRQEYSYADYLESMPAATVYYRIKQVDKNGACEYFPIRTLSCKLWNDAVVNICPIPASNVIHMDQKQPLIHATVTIMNAMGMEVMQLPLTQTRQTVDISLLPAGNYYLRITADGGISQTQQVSIVR